MGVCVGLVMVILLSSRVGVEFRNLVEISLFWALILVAKLHFLVSKLVCVLIRDDPVREKAGGRDSAGRHVHYL